MGDVTRRLRENATSIVSTLVTGIWLAALLLGFDWWLPFMLFGYIALIPIVSILFGEDEDEAADWQERAEETTAERQQGADAADTPSEDALQTLRDRYARGELTDEQFERKLERLIETETLEDAEDRHRRERPGTGQDRGHATDRDLETETE